MSNQKIKMILNVAEASDEVTKAVANELEKPDDDEALEKILKNEHTTDTQNMQASSATI